MLQGYLDAVRECDAAKQRYFQQFEQVERTELEIEVQMQLLEKGGADIDQIQRMSLQGNTIKQQT